MDTSRHRPTLYPVASFACFENTRNMIYQNANQIFAIGWGHDLYWASLECRLALPSSFPAFQLVLLLASNHPSRPGLAGQLAKAPLGQSFCLTQLTRAYRRRLSYSVLGHGSWSEVFVCLPGSRSQVAGKLISSERGKRENVSQTTLGRVDVVQNFEGRHSVTSVSMAPKAGTKPIVWHTRMTLSDAPMDRP